jgi:hypothetical protein
VGELTEYRDAIEEYLWGRRLWLHPQKRVISRVQDGIRFLGYRVFPQYSLVPQQNALRFRRRLRRMQRDYAAGRMDLEAIRGRIMSWLGHAGRASSRRVLKHLLQIKFTRGDSVDQSRVAWRLVQQQQPGQPPVGDSQQQLARES